MYVRLKLLMIFSFAVGTLVIMTGPVLGEPETPNLVNPKWQRNLPAGSCPGASDTNCHRSSPVVADLTGDGPLEIIVGTNNGHVVAFNYAGSVLWDVDVAPYFGMGGGQEQIHSSPAVADIDKDGLMEIVVGTGTTNPSTCTQGGVIVLEHDGRRKDGWPFLTVDESIPPAGCRDSVFSTPALGDLDRDGDLEIVFGSYDKRIYALHHDGRLLPGFPPNSYHFTRFGWGNLQRKLADSTWSSPSLIDVNNDGFLNIVIGSDEGNFDNTWLPVLANWTCPYRPPLTAGYCGGSIYALDRAGQRLPGFPRYKYEVIQSTPALVDLNGDGRSEIFVGTGSFYYNHSSDKPTIGFRLFGMDSIGNDLPGWANGKAVGGYIATSPSIGDITGDGRPNIVAAASDNKLYAWHTDGQLVAGFPMTPRTHYNQIFGSKDAGTGFILADYTGNGVMEIFFAHGWEINIVDGMGRQLTATQPSETRPVYYTNGRIWNNPVVADLDGNGHMELIVQNSQLTVWDLPDSSGLADWPMFKHDAARTGAYGGSVLRVTPEEIYLIAEVGNQQNFYPQILAYSDQTGFSWSATASRPDLITLPQSSGSLLGQTTIPVNVRLPGNLPVGIHSLGKINVNAIQGGKIKEVDEVSITVKIVYELNQSFLPFVN